MFDAKTATAQEVFDYVVGHLVRQGERSSDGVGCLYRGPNGTKCAVGCLIPDELYIDALEGHSLGDVCDSFKDIADKAGLKKHEKLLHRLQYFHDSSFSWKSQEGFVTQLEFFSRNLNLKVPEIAYTYQPKTGE